jgi:Tfp pilus assembly protein PilX
MRMTRDTPRPQGERGFSMFLVIMAMFVVSMFVAAGFAAANGDLPMSGQSKDRKAAYTAAEAGLNFYLTHLNQDSDYWTHCTNVPKPTPTENAPVNQPWKGTGTDPRTWRNIPGSTGRYTIELLPVNLSTNPSALCDENDSKTMIDMSTGMFRVRSTGEASKTSGDSGNRRSIVASFRRQGFLDFLYFTYYEDMDPAAYATTTQQDNAEKYCAGLFRKSRPRNIYNPTGFNCTEIQFAPTDQVKGPLHSNDSLLVCNSPTFGRTDNNKADKIEVSQYPNSTVAAGGCTNSPNIQGVFKSPVPTMNPPASNAALRVVAQNGGDLFTGKTFIQLNGTTMNVTTTVNGVRTYTAGMEFPDNGVIYVQGTGDSCTAQFPTDVKYTDEDACGNVYVSGTYSKSLTIAAENDVIIAPTDGKTMRWYDAIKDKTPPKFELKGVDGSNGVLGLIANNFVRVGHPVDRSSGCANVTNYYDNDNLAIDAAILSIDHSFIVDNYNCGAKLGLLQVKGAIAQRYRGPVGTSGGTGFIKDYVYDDRLKYRSPPHFISPVDSAWAIVRSNEQVPSPGN